jgi:hypothetical protein
MRLPVSEAVAARRTAGLMVARAVEDLGRDLGVAGHLNLAFPIKAGVPADMAALLGKLGSPSDKGER